MISFIRFRVILSSYSPVTNNSFNRASLFLFFHFSPFVCWSNSFWIICLSWYCEFFGLLRTSFAFFSFLFSMKIRLFSIAIFYCFIYFFVFAFYVLVFILRNYCYYNISTVWFNENFKLKTRFFFRLYKFIILISKLCWNWKWFWILLKIWFYCRISYTILIGFHFIIIIIIMNLFNICFKI